jgi:hypothetical protein
MCVPWHFPVPPEISSVSASAASVARVGVFSDKFSLTRLRGKWYPLQCYTLIIVIKVIIILFVNPAGIPEKKEK